ncbi:MAG: hypothetical protein ACXVGO_09500 [Mycobacterium sp.]
MTFDFQRALGYGMMRPNYFPANPTTGFATGFENGSTIDWVRSVGVAYDTARTCATPTRPLSETILSNPFNVQTWPAWTQIHPGSAAAAIGGNPSDPDPNLHSFLDMATGYDLASGSLMAGVQKLLGSVPDSFGVGTIVRLNQVGTNVADALQFLIQTSSGKMLLVRFYDMRVDAFIGGIWQQLAAWGGDWWTEWWIECAYAGNNQYAVTLYAGTSKMPTTLVGALPAGNPANNSLLCIVQLSGVSNNRHSQVSVVNVGQTQLAAPMALCLPTVNVATSPVTANLAILVEDVSINLLPNTYLKASISKDDGATWAPVTLTNCGMWGPGEIVAYPMPMLIGCAPFSAGNGTALKALINTTADGLYAVQGLTMFWD